MYGESRGPLPRIRKWTPGEMTHIPYPRLTGLRLQRGLGSMVPRRSTQVAVVVLANMDKRNQVRRDKRIRGTAA